MDMAHKFASRYGVRYILFKLVFWVYPWRYQAPQNHLLSVGAARVQCWAENQALCVLRMLIHCYGFLLNQK